MSKFGWNKESSDFEISWKYLYSIIGLSIMLFAFIFVAFVDGARELGFEEGYVCAFEHYESVQVGTFDLDEYSPSKYCEAFSELFDFYATPDFVTVNGANIPVQDLIPENRRRLIEEGSGKSD